MYNKQIADEKASIKAAEKEKRMSEDKERLRVAKIIEEQERIRNAQKKPMPITGILAPAPPSYEEAPPQSDPIAPTEDPNYQMRPPNEEPESAPYQPSEEDLKMMAQMESKGKAPVTKVPETKAMKRLEEAKLRALDKQRIEDEGRGISGPTAPAVPEKLSKEDKLKQHMIELKLQMKADQEKKQFEKDERRGVKKY